MDWCNGQKRPYQQHNQSPYQQHNQSPYQQHNQSPYKQHNQSPKMLLQAHIDITINGYNFPEH